MSRESHERQYRKQHSECGGTITEVAEPRIGPVLFCSCAADNPEEWAEFIKLQAKSAPTKENS